MIMPDYNIALLWWRISQNCI